METEPSKKLNENIVISKGFSLSLYVVAIVIFSLVFFVGLFLSYKNFTSILKRNNDDLLMKNIAQNFILLLEKKNEKSQVISILETFFQKKFALYPSESLLIFLLVDSTNNVLFDSSSASPTSSSMFTSILSANPSFLQKAAASKDGLATMSEKETHFKSYIVWMDEIKSYFITCRVI